MNGIPATRIVITPVPVRAAAATPVEFCEHKGIGHPDSLCDGVAEAVSRALCRAYRAAYGAIQHYNVDKALLIGGQSAPRFGGGVVHAPLRLIVCGRATPLPDANLADFVTGTARDYLRSVLHCDIGPFAIESTVRPGSPNLRRVVGAGAVRANDTSFGCGFAPPTTLEALVLRIAALLRSAAFRTCFPFAGDDYKIMGVRDGADLDLTVALAFVDRAVADAAAYFAGKHAIVDVLRAEAGDGVRIALNALDDPDTGDESGLYLTVTGLSAEHGDDGQVGRGNRANGLITPQRTMSLEATAGKNSAAHVGKLYNLLAFEIAGAIAAEHPHARDVAVQLVSTIGRPVSEPAVVAVTIETDGAVDAVFESAVRRIARAHFERVDELTARLVDGTVAVF